MDKLQFDQTKTQLRIFGNALSVRLSMIFNSISGGLTTTNKNSGWTPKEILYHTYLVNQYFIIKIDRFNDLLHEGLVNEESEHSESDLNLVETILNVSVFKIQSLPEFKTPISFSFEELELKLAVQVQILNKLINKSPSAYANNFTSEMKVIPGIKLDVYQMIYFVMKHAYHHLNQVNTLESIKTSLNSKINSNKEKRYVLISVGL